LVTLPAVSQSSYACSVQLCTVLLKSALVLYLSVDAPARTGTYTLSLHDALPIYRNRSADRDRFGPDRTRCDRAGEPSHRDPHLRSEEHTSELQSRENLVCRLLLEKRKRKFRSLRLQWSVRKVRGRR